MLLFWILSPDASPGDNKARWMGGRERERERERRERERREKREKREERGERREREREEREREGGRKEDVKSHRGVGAASFCRARDACKVCALGASWSAFACGDWA